LCGFDPYLSQKCGPARPRFALIRGPFRTVQEAEHALDLARSLEPPPGYPFAATSDELPIANHGPGLIIVLALFAERAAAESLRRRPGPETTLVELRPIEQAQKQAVPPENVPFDTFLASRSAVVELIEVAPAWAKSDLEALEKRLNEATWLPLPRARTRRERELAKLAPVCTLPSGRLFVTNQAALLTFREGYAPVTCPDGRQAWVAKASTRLDSVVLRTEHGAIRVQTVLVECDSPVFQLRPFERAGTSSYEVPGDGC
jgi:hypothetical protein